MMASCCRVHESLRHQVATPKIKDLVIFVIVKVNGSKGIISTILKFYNDSDFEIMIPNWLCKMISWKKWAIQSLNIKDHCDTAASIACLVTEEFKSLVYGKQHFYMFCYETSQEQKMLD